MCQSHAFLAHSDLVLQPCLCRNHPALALVGCIWPPAAIFPSGQNALGMIQINKLVVASEVQHAHTWVIKLTTLASLRVHRAIVLWGHHIAALHPEVCLHQKLLYAITVNHCMQLYSMLMCHTALCARQVSTHALHVAGAFRACFLSLAIPAGLNVMHGATSMLICCR